MHARVNPYFVPGVVPQPPREAVRAFHRALPGYAPTPLHRLRGLAAALGLGEVYLKDESQRFGLDAFKVLGASWALHRVREQQPGPPPLTVSSATEGNHGRGLAWAARHLGVRVVIYIPRSAAAARVDRLRREGADVVLVDGTYEDAVDRCAAESRANGWQVVADVGYGGYVEIPRTISEGYSTLFAEVEEQLAASGFRAPEVMLVQAGVGGLLHAAVDQVRGRTVQPMLAAVEPVQADPLFTSVNAPDGEPTPSAGRLDSIMAGLNCGRVSLSAWPVIRRGVELFLTIEDYWAETAIRRLAQPEPGDPVVVAGEAGAAGVAGLLALLAAPELLEARQFLRLGTGSAVLVINTEGATDPESYARIVGSVGGGLRGGPRAR